jgi:hypothetical protein
MSYPFIDQTEGDFQHEQDAAERAKHLKLVHSATVGGDEASDSEIQKLAVDFADTTDACNFILARYAATSEKFYDPSKRVRDLLCAIIGATGGNPEYVEVTDEDLAARMGCSTRTVQNARNEFRSWPDHPKLVGIKDNFREPPEQGAKSHPHAYKCRLTMMSAAATADARLLSGERGEVIAEAARVEADAVAGFVNRPAKRKRKATDSEMVVREAEAAANNLMRAVNRQGLARNVDMEKLQQARDRLREMLEAFDEAYGFHAETSTQKKEEEQSEAAGVETPVGPAPERRVEAVVDEVESPQVENFSTCNDSTESTTYDFADSGAGEPPDLSEWVWIENGRVCNRLPPPGNDALDAAILAEVGRLESGLKAWGSVTDRLGEGVSDATG